MNEHDETTPTPTEEFPAATDRPARSDEDITGECAGDREELEPRTTADCAGEDLVKEYDNEEDGGS